mmetsp:Transcript_23100/g.44852  ORF Transcript_23100/g.44852 Transcript_23100/m.44852 type:complete len:561 (+) Transcript_23100:61-1743(+)|eukprot:CAMPEP_0173388202 /NCGR_PEP_ID=MMETSP1356-20130122/10573_1 /TAXON_ID=77927 ORGANISM="Hemiselmis virescens, Strain PCC157" /NCGR_SAMPLE_ID=MMETSP1356 /ASSEMBLY_ACC=CAM_ASM_000847 /LENGTH=560 /DNA_ID=CAMNT_0014345057 /DNA_START=65 /DNA_END=1744 /DNA_ORIENTATION=+
MASSSAEGDGRSTTWDASVRESGMDPTPVSSVVTPLLTDMYQVTMCYGYWKAGRHEMLAAFDCFFRTAPFEGEFCIFAGLSQVMSLVNTYKFDPDHIAYLKSQMPFADEDFFNYLANLDCSKVKILAFREGTVVFPREPLLRIEGPIGICQLLETTLLCMVNYASLVATNAARMRIAVGPSKTLLEMGLRRAQGVDGGLSASRYSYIGGFDGSSNLMAGYMFGIKVSGTHAHSFVQSFSSLDDLPRRSIELPGGGVCEDFVGLVQHHMAKLGYTATNEGELTAYVAYCQAFPRSFLALVDTYDTMASGVRNFLACSMAMIELGYKPIGIRLDSGDLAYYSKQARQLFRDVEKMYGIAGLADTLQIVASNDVDEDKLYDLEKEGHEIDMFGIGTRLVTCMAQPALGCVFKLVEMDGKPRIKLSQDIIKMSIPARKRVYRLYGGQDGLAVTDIMLSEEEVLRDGPPVKGKGVTYRTILEPQKSEECVPTKVVEMLECVWDGKLVKPLPTVNEMRQHAQESLESHNKQVTQRNNPVRYPVVLSTALSKILHDLWAAEASGGVK